MKRIITLFTALCLLLSLCLPALADEPAAGAGSAGPVPVKISAGTPTYKDESYSYAERGLDLVSRMTEEEMISQTAGYNSPAIARLGVATYMWWNEALHGYNQEGWFGIQTDGSSFPSSYSMGASWDPDIYYREAVQIGAEIRERVKGNRYNLTMFSPTINLARDPRWGRNDEGYGEDPYITGLLGSAFVNGVEGKTYAGEYIRKNANGEGVKQAGTTIKHYAANNSEKNRYTSGADNVTVREMREYYTRASRIVTKNADVSSVMMAYSSVSGIPISFSSYYMDTLLRQSYGFSGYIVSDCDSVAVSYNRSVHKNNPHTNANYTLGEGFANALANGLDLQCNAGETDSLGSYASNYEQLKAEADGSPVKTDKGYFTRQQAEVSVARLMTQRMKLGEFDEDNFYATEGKARLDAGNDGEYVNGVPGQTQERIDLADDLSRSTIVLLKNENDALPIKASEIDAAADGYDVAIVGPVGQSNFRGGYSSTLRNEANVVTIEQAIRTAFADETYYPAATVANANVNYYYGFSSSVNRNSFTGLQSSQIDVSQVGEDLDLAIVVVGQGNGDSREDGDRTDLNLAQAQIDLIKAVKEKNPKKLVLVMETYGPVQMVDDIVDNADAILWSGFNGFRKGTGFGEAITGKNNPSGRMNATWLKDMINDTPGFFDYSLFPSNGEGGRTYMYNVEDTIYPFGYGLSYSDFAYAASGSMLGASAKNGLTIGTAGAPITGDSTIDVSFQIKNNSDVPGKQVAEVYAVSPGAGTNNIPLKRLVGFDKVEVGANATVDVTIPVKVTDLAFFNEEADCYELTPGTWKIWVAMSSDFNEATDLSEEFKIENGAIREDPAVVTVKPTQIGDAAKGISERVIFDLSKDPAENIIDPGIAVAMTNEKLYGVRVVKNVPGVDIGVDAATATEAGNGFANPDTAASLPRLEAGKTADELPHIGEKFTLPDTYKIDFDSNRPEVVAVEDGQLVMKGKGVATITATVTGPSGVSASEEFTVCVKVEPGLEAITVGETKYKKFDPQNFGVNVAVPVGTSPDSEGLAVTATAVEGATVEYLSKDADGNFVPNESHAPASIPGTVYIRVTGDDLIEQIYEVNYVEDAAIAPMTGAAYALATEIAPGKTYVIVADGKYALTNRQEGPALRTYAGGATTTLASKPVVVVDGKINSMVSNDMLWTVEEAEAPAAYDGQAQYFLKDTAGNYLRRGSGSSGQGAQLLSEPLFNTVRYNTWSFKAYEGMDATYSLYANSEREYGRDYPFYVYGNETSFDSPARAQRTEEDPFGFMNNEDCSKITLYEYTEIVGGGEDIDFTNPADEPKYTVMGQDTYALAEGTGVTLTPTADAFEPVTSGCGGSAADSTPKDLIRIPVTGDWTATVNLAYNPNDAATAASTFYAFMAMAGEDYQNMAGIRGTGTQCQDFLRQDGVIMDPVQPANGFTAAGLYWLRLQKEGTTYTASISTDGEEFTELFIMEDTDIQADYIVLDAYKTASSSWGSQAVWDITLKSLVFGDGAQSGPSKTALKKAIADAEAIDKSEYTEASVAALETAVANAVLIRDKADATQDEIDDATQAVRDAIAALVKEDKADTAALEAAITRAEAVNRDLFTDESLAAMDAALAEARTALAESRLQAVIDDAARALNDAIDALEKKPEDPDKGLKDYFADYFKIGTCLSASEARKPEGQAFTLKHFNSVTCENEMKPQEVLDQAASQAAGDNVTVKVRLTDNTRAILDFCSENHIPMRGHVFAWYSQTPGWLFNENFENNGATVSQEIMDQRLESYIKNYFELLATEYPDLEFYSFDVCNEAFTDSNPSGMRGANQSGWIRVYGDDTYIYKAFEYADKYKPEGCMLAYNDYNEYNDGKLEAMYELCKNLYEKGWLDCVGMQSHLELPSNPTIERYRNAMAKFASIGCKIMVTELDVQNNNDAQQLADYYQQLFEIYTDYKDQIEAVVFWGNNDGVSWRSSRNPLLFDRNYQPKPAYYAVLDAISDHEHVFEEVRKEPTCTEDGYVADACTICDRVIVREVLPALGHDWDEGVVTKEPTATEPGVRTFTCQRCGETKTQRIRPTEDKLPPDIDFTIPADAEKFEVIGKETGDIVEGVGLSLVTSQGGVEPAKQNIAETPHDVIEVPVDGDWTATLEFVFETNGAANGYYQFFGFYGATDYNNMVGIRGGDGALQDFIRKEGAITEETKASSPGLSSNGATYWFRLEKSGDTYTAYRSSDGENFTQMFDYTETGIEAEKIVIDAYTGMTTGYKFTLKSLTFDEPGAVIVNKSKLDKAITDAEAIDKDAYTPESVAALEEAVAAAKAVQADENATQADVNEAAKAVTDAIDALVPVAEPVNRAELDKAIEDAEKVEKDKYTDESVAALEKALADAKAVGEDADQAAVDAAADALKAAIEALEEKTDDFLFEDVKDPAKFYFDPVYWAFNADPQITNGTDATHFGPDNACTRGHVVTFLWRAAGCPDPKSATTPFTDLKPGAFYEKAVAWAVEEGITNGKTATTFAPDDPCNRGQIVTFLWRFAGEEEPKSAATPFTDLKPGAFYGKAVAWAVENEVTNGLTATTFGPDSTCTRGQVVTFLYRATQD